MGWLKSDITIFIYKIAGIYVLWYLIYELWLLPAGQLDAWLCINVAEICYNLLQLFGYEAFLNSRIVGLQGSAGIHLVDGCSGIAAIGLFIGFVVAYPGRWVPRVCFIIIGIGIIYLVNILRTFVLAITLANYSGMFDFMHDYSTTAIFYLVVFCMWMIWANLGDIKNVSRWSSKPQAAA